MKELWKIVTRTKYLLQGYTGNWEFAGIRFWDERQQICSYKLQNRATDVFGVVLMEKFMRLFPKEFLILAAVTLWKRGQFFHPLVPISVLLLMCICKTMHTDDAARRLFEPSQEHHPLLLDLGLRTMYTNTRTWLLVQTKTRIKLSTMCVIAAISLGCLVSPVVVIVIETDTYSFSGYVTDTKTVLNFGFTVLSNLLRTGKLAAKISILLEVVHGP